MHSRVTFVPGERRRAGARREVPELDGAVVRAAREAPARQRREGQHAA